jgi:CRP/FNR family transcriptional regulator, cyclic AMP receptor protein
VPRSLLIPPPRDVARLLDVDPELGGLLSGERRELAEHEFVVRVRRVPVGPWPEPLNGHRRDRPGMLILTGVLALELALEERLSIELLGPGDLVRFWQPNWEEMLLPAAAMAFVRSPLTVAVLDEQFAATATRYPEIFTGLIGRLAERSERLATTQAIAQLTGVDRRLRALLWHLAERWGRVTPEGVVVGLALSHTMLAQLTGARRPTVSTALAHLAARQEVRRLPDGSWLLLGEPQDAAA